MEKITVKKGLFCLPWTQTILGTHLGKNVNFMALDWLTRVNYQPPMMGICVNRTNASSNAILDNHEFSINVPNINMVEITDYTGIVSGKSVDKSDLFPVFYGDLKASPMITSCPLTMELKLAETVELPTNYFFIGEIINIYTEEQFITEGKPDIKKIRPFLLTMPDNKFWAIGECVGRAWSDGVEMRNRLKNKS
jgi:flavin reductase (DIM6/NTAB) family NADH-FMN oxidoreductase RutF